MEISIKNFGAVGDGAAKDTVAIQQAIDECSKQGGGKVVAEPGVYLTSTLYLKDNVELHLSPGARLQGSTAPDDYDDFRAPGFYHQYAVEGNSKCLICASGVKNIAITGSGEINGAGPEFYDKNIDESARFYSKPAIHRPRMVIFFNCRNVRIEDASFIDSPCWTFWLIACEQVNIHRIKVIGDQKMINNDGIDIDSCRDLTISDCFLKTGDDCLILRAIQSVQAKPAICENVTITNCTLDSCCQGIRVGCPSDNVIRNCTFDNIVINSTTNGINIENPKRYLVEDNNCSLHLSNIMFSNFTINSEFWPIKIFVEDGVKLRNLSKISFSNFRITSGQPCLIQGSRETIIEDISLNNISVESSGDDAIICRNCRKIKINNVELSNCHQAMKEIIKQENS
jgi:polygalacturonase